MARGRVLSDQRARVTGERSTVSAVQPLRAIIADDEPLARQALRRFLLADGNATVVAEAEDTPALVDALRSHRADVLFLDVTMPGGSGLDAVPFVPADTAIVFTTAHAEHAVAAFALDAADYLLKPFGRDRFGEALERVRRRQLSARSADVALAPAPPPLRIVLVRVGPRLHPVAASTIWRVEGADDLVRVVTAERSWLHGTTLSAIAAQLDSALFVRVHRRHVVNLQHVARIEAHDARRVAAIFPDGTRVACSRAGSAELRARARGGAALAR